MRAHSYKKRGKYNKAFDDYERFKKYSILLKINTQYLYLQNIGELYLLSGKFDEAIKIYSQCLQIENQPSFYFYRGTAYSLLKNYKEALNDYVSCLNTATKYEHFQFYSKIWMYIINSKININNKYSSLTSLVGKETRDELKNLIVSLYLGNINSVEIVNKKDKWKESDAEMYFYIGQFFLINGDNTRANEMFNLCVETDEFGKIEHRASIVELERIKRGEY